MIDLRRRAFLFGVPAVAAIAASRKYFIMPPQPKIVMAIYDGYNYRLLYHHCRDDNPPTLSINGEAKVIRRLPRQGILKSRDIAAGDIVELDVSLSEDKRFWMAS